MCGICGYCSTSSPYGPDTIVRMCNAISHRGPDDSGVWRDKTRNLVLGHRRLSVLDLSDAGKQPMISASGRYVIVFNGEIYNHLNLRKSLVSAGSGVSWHGHSDTETLLACIEVWGIVKTLRRLVGMFAFAVWDKQTETLALARDRMGEKPLYFGAQNGVFMFASELGALRAHPAFEGAVDRNSLASLLRYNCIPGDQCIYRGISKLPPGTLLRVSVRDGGVNPDGVPENYWCLHDAIAAGEQYPFSGSDEEAMDNLDALLRQSIAGQMLSDVPLGVMLSGGIDSTVVTAIMQQLSVQPVETFTIDFADTPFSEAAYAREIADLLGTKHNELCVSGADALKVIPDLPNIYSEPFADSSQIPTYLVSQLARSKVTVALSGDGGDELFGGYNRYLQGLRSWKLSQRFPYPLRLLAKHFLTLLPQGGWDVVFNGAGKILPGSCRLMSPGYKAYKLAGVFQADSVDQFYRYLTTHWKNANDLVIGASMDGQAGIERSDCLVAEERMMALDAVTYLPDDILTKVDRAAMAVSLETRVPLLDHRIVEFAWTLPPHFRIRNNEGKWLLRRVLEKYVPRELFNRPKSGFSAPLGDWLRGPLRDWAEELLAEDRLLREGFFHPEKIRQSWNAHLKGSGNRQYHLWDVLMFQAWHEANKR